MTDLCELEAAIHDIRRSNEILEILSENISKNVKSIVSMAKLPEGLTAEDYLLEFEIYRQRDHCNAAERLLAALQDRKPVRQEPRVFYRNMTVADLADGAEIMLAGKPHILSQSLIGPDWWDCSKDGKLQASFPDDHLLKHAWVKGAKRR